MCLIIYKEEGIPMSSTIYKGIARSYSLRNRDGMGFALKRNNEIYISKGYFDLTTFINSIKALNVKRSDELLIHLRKVSRGSLNIKNCHPIVISEDAKLIDTDEGFVKFPVLAHNGTIHRFPDKEWVQSKAKYIYYTNSDTYRYVQSISDPFIYNNLDKLFSLIPKFGETQIGYSSKIVVLFPDKKGFKFGDGWIRDQNSKIWYSNLSYKYKNMISNAYAYDEEHRYGVYP